MQAKLQRKAEDEAWLSIISSYRAHPPAHAPAAAAAERVAGGGGGGTGAEEALLEAGPLSLPLLVGPGGREVGGP